MLCGDAKIGLFWGFYFRLRYIVGKCCGGMLNFQILFLCIYLISLIIIGHSVDVKFKPK